MGFFATKSNLQTERAVAIQSEYVICMCGKRLKVDMLDKGQRNGHMLLRKDLEGICQKKRYMYVT